jgi:pSer/pThr/pTyr-binding forkhead associated (FHA) protein
VSRCHAVIGHHPNDGFYIMDLGSSNGTFVNRSRLIPLQQRPLNDGDLIDFSKSRVEFFISGWHASSLSIQDTQG